LVFVSFLYTRYRDAIRSMSMKRLRLSFVFFSSWARLRRALWEAQRRPKLHSVFGPTPSGIWPPTPGAISSPRSPCISHGLSDEREIGQVGAGNFASRSQRPKRGKLTPEEEGCETVRYPREEGTCALPWHRHLAVHFTFRPDHNMINAFLFPGRARSNILAKEWARTLWIEAEKKDELAKTFLAHEMWSTSPPITWRSGAALQLESETGKNLQSRHLGRRSCRSRSISGGSRLSTRTKKFEAIAGDRNAFCGCSSGYSPYGAVDMFRTLRKLCDERHPTRKSRDQELSERAIQS